MIDKHRTDGLCTAILGKVSGTFQTWGGDREGASLMDQENNLYRLYAVCATIS